MANGHKIVSYDEFRKLDPELREYYIYENLYRVQTIWSEFSEFKSQHEAKYAAKWVEKAFIAVISFVFLAVLTALLLQVIPTAQF